MRFYTFFIIAFATVISVNAVGTENLSKEIRNCNSRLEFHQIEVVKTTNKLQKPNYNTEKMQNDELNLYQFSKLSSEMCCYSLGAETDYLKAEQIIKGLNSITDKYNILLSKLKSKKPVIDKDPAFNAAAKKFVNTIGTGAISLFDCMHLNAASHRQQDVENIKSKFSSVYTDVQNTFGV